MSARGTVTGLALACHPGPTVAVSTLTALLALVAGAGWSVAALVVAAVLTGQLVIGWSNDLLDAGRDRSSGRRDKPIAEGLVAESTVRHALVLALVLTVLLSLATGWRPGGLHLLAVVGSGLAYNLGLKAGGWSFLPYAVAFGALPAVVWLAVGPGWSWPPGWTMAVGALLGVGAHLLNALPDLAQDERDGIRGLPHRLGATRTRWLAPLLLLTGSVVVVWAPAGAVPGWAWGALLVSGVLAVTAWTTRGRTPFVAAMLLAVVNVLGLVLRG